MSIPSPPLRRLLQRVFTAALDRNLSPETAETYGVWVLCFARYCAAHEIEPPAAAQVPNFLTYLIGRADVTADERSHALDALLFALTEVPEAFVSGAPANRTLPERAASTADAAASGESPAGYRSQRASTPGGKALTHLLMDTDIGLYDAVRLRVRDVDREAGVLHVTSGDGQGARRIALSRRLRTDLAAAARNALRDGSPFLFPEAHVKYVGTDEAPDTTPADSPVGSPAETPAAEAPADRTREKPPAEEPPAEKPSPETSATDSAEEEKPETSGDGPTSEGDPPVRTIFPDA